MQWKIKEIRPTEGGRRIVQKFALMPAVCRNSRGEKVCIWLEDYQQEQRLVGHRWLNTGKRTPIGE